MRPDYRWLAVVIGNLVFLFLLGQANHYLSRVMLGTVPLQTYLFLVGLPVTFAALRLSLGQALAATLPTILAAEAAMPFPVGTLLLPATACVCGTIAVRTHFNRFEPSTAVFAGLIINLVLAVSLTVVASWRGSVPLARLAFDLLVSQLALVAITGWFFAAQTSWLAFFGYQVETELRESL